MRKCSNLLITIHQTSNKHNLIIRSMTKLYFISTEITFQKQVIILFRFLSSKQVRCYFVLSFTVIFI